MQILWLFCIKMIIFYAENDLQLIGFGLFYQCIEVKIFDLNNSANSLLLNWKLLTSEKTR